MITDLATLSIISLAFGATLGYLCEMIRFVVEANKVKKN